MTIRASTGASWSEHTQDIQYGPASLMKVSYRVVGSSTSVT